MLWESEKQEEFDKGVFIDFVMDWIFHRVFQFFLKYSTRSFIIYGRSPHRKCMEVAIAFYSPKVNTMLLRIQAKIDFLNFFWPEYSKFSIYFRRINRQVPLKKINFSLYWFLLEIKKKIENPLRTFYEIFILQTEVWE